MSRLSKSDFIRSPVKLTLAAAMAGWGVTWVTRFMIKKVFQASLNEIMTNVYSKNLWEFVSATTKVGAQNIVETNLRVQSGKPISRPLGTPKKFPALDSLMFDFAQLRRLPTSPDTLIDTAVVIGPRAQRPLKLKIPILIGGMSYGPALSEKAKIGLALGATAAGTATNTGEGPFLPSERKVAKHLVLQYSKSKWAKSDAVLKQGDTIEIHLGQGAKGGVGHKMLNKDMGIKLRQRFELLPGQDAVHHSRHKGMNHPKDLKPLVDRLRRVSGGVPIGVKMAAGKFLEEDLDWAILAGVDFISLDGANGGSKGTPPIIQDDFGLPTLFAICRATQHMRKRGVAGQVSLIVSGGLITPGDFLKALALGADAVAIGTIALFAMTHTQVLKAMPFEPPTQVVWYDGEVADSFNPQEGGKNLCKFLQACTSEIVEGIRCLGKTSIHQLDQTDLFAYDREIAKLAQVPYAGDLPDKVEVPPAP